MIFMNALDDEHDDHVDVDDDVVVIRSDELQFPLRSYEHPALTRFLVSMMH